MRVNVILFVIRQIKICLDNVQYNQQAVYCFANFEFGANMEVVNTFSLFIGGNLKKMVVEQYIMYVYLDRNDLIGVLSEEFY